MDGPERAEKFIEVKTSTSTTSKLQIPTSASTNITSRNNLTRTSTKKSKVCSSCSARRNTGYARFGNSTNAQSSYMYPSVWEKLGFFLEPNVSINKAMVAVNLNHPSTVKNSVKALDRKSIPATKTDDVAPNKRLQRATTPSIEALPWLRTPSHAVTSKYISTHTPTVALALTLTFGGAVRYARGGSRIGLATALALGSYLFSVRSKETSQCEPAIPLYVSVLLAVFSAMTWRLKVLGGPSKTAGLLSVLGALHAHMLTGVRAKTQERASSPKPLPSAA